MKYLIVIIVLTFTSCKKKESENIDKIDDTKEIKNVDATDEFIKIPYDLKENYLDSLSKKIVPNSNYQYWQYATYRQGSDIETYIILNEGGDSSYRNKINKKPRPNYNYGIFFGGHPNFSCKYIVTVNNNKIYNLKTEGEFRDFLGRIDNLEEAILLARTYGYQLDNIIKASEYRKLPNGFELKLMKYHEFPRRKESVLIEINRNGFIKTKSLGIYCEGTDCRE
jgi:hypothetical protein